MNLLRNTLLLALFMTVTSSQAEPASWYKWCSKLDYREICAQTSPGEGWEQLAPAYRDARCENLKKY